MRILVVEDEPKMGELLSRGLREEGLYAEVAKTGQDALWLAETGDWDALVLDLMLPDYSGVEVCRRLRAARNWVPVLMLTARAEVPTRVAGLDAGADDYLVKPFAFAELLARLRALLRRGEIERPVVLEVEDLRLDPATRRVWRGRQEVVLTAKEFDLLHLFVRRPDHVLTRDWLLEHAWDIAYERGSNVVDVCVRSLRDKVDRPFGCESLETVRGVGYRLRATSRTAKPVRRPKGRR
jgi:two-component system OmpR family response regulator